MFDSKRHGGQSYLKTTISGKGSVSRNLSAIYRIQSLNQRKHAGLKSQPGKADSAEKTKTFIQGRNFK